MTAIQTLAAIRFGYGLPLPFDAPVTPEAMLKALAGPDVAAQTWPIDGMAVVQPKLAEMKGMKGGKKTDPILKARYGQLSQELAQSISQAASHSFLRALTAPDGFRERLVAFWANHFTVSTRENSAGMLPAAMVEDVVRPGLTGRFADLLTEATLHPAMLSFLDQTQSTGPNSSVGLRKGKGLNENLARELIELHSMGVGAHYSQGNVREMAILLAGVTYDMQRGMWFDQKRAEPGAKTVFGKTYGGEGLDAIRQALGDLGRRPETAAHIARKLAVHFVSDTPDAVLVAALESSFLETDGDLLAVYRTLLLHPAAWLDKTEKVRQPFEFLVAAFRGLGVTVDQFLVMKNGLYRKAVLQAMGSMGQSWRRPEGPDGWPEDDGEWISPNLLAARITWAMQSPHRLIKALPDPVKFAQNCLADRASDGLLRVVSRAEDRREGVGLVLASAEFNRR